MTKSVISRRNPKMVYTCAGHPPVTLCRPLSLPRVRARLVFSVQPPWICVLSCRVQPQARTRSRIFTS